MIYAYSPSDVVAHIFLPYSKRIYIHHLTVILIDLDNAPDKNISPMIRFIFLNAQRDLTFHLKTEARENEIISHYIRQEYFDLAKQRIFTVE